MTCLKVEGGGNAASFIIYIILIVWIFGPIVVQTVIQIKGIVQSFFGALKMVFFYWLRIKLIICVFIIRNFPSFCGFVTQGISKFKNKILVNRVYYIKTHSRKKYKNLLSQVKTRPLKISTCYLHNTSKGLSDYTIKIRWTPSLNRSKNYKNFCNFSSKSKIF